MGQCSVCTRQKVVYQWGSLGNGRERRERLSRCLEINESYMSLGSWSVTAGLAAYDDHVGEVRRCQQVLAARGSTGSSEARVVPNDGYGG
jgi:hypothetical protein